MKNWMLRSKSEPGVRWWGHEIVTVCARSNKPLPSRPDSMTTICYNGINVKRTKHPGLCRVVLITVAIAACFYTASCTTTNYRSDPNLVGYSERGVASFYAMKFQFRKTSSGERFNQLALTAAHKTLPFGTRVRVTNLRNRKSVTVKINDRGPFIDGRIIDLTRYAFSRIEHTERGLMDVKIEVIP